MRHFFRAHFATQSNPIKASGHAAQMRRLGVVTAILLAGAFSAFAEWPQYRGPNASGVDARTGLPTKWDVTAGENVRWQTPIPGMAHSSPIAWGDRIYVATAVAKEKAELKVGLYGDIASAKDGGTQQWRLMALDASTGRIVWDTLALEAAPKVQRHTKASHCNSTPATDGRFIVAVFGSEGMFCFDSSGKLLWKKDLGPMDSGYYASPTAQWGFGSSPVIHDGKVILVCDVQKDSFIAAFDVADGRELWRQSRKDVPTWGTPTVIEAEGAKQIVVNGWRESAGYDFGTGSKLWTLDGGGDIPVPTPIFAHGHIFLTSAHGKWRPIRAIRPAARGDITPADPGKTNDSIAWAHPRQGNYMQTPIVVGDLLFASNDMGIVTCFDAKSGTIRFSERLSQKGQGFTASPVSDGKHVYFPSELGSVFVLKASDTFTSVSVNALPETCMSTPAIHDGMLLFRTQGRVVAIAEGARSQGVPLSAEAASAKEAPPRKLAKPDARLVGIWEGTLNAGASLRLRVEIRDSGEKMTGTLTSLDQNNATLEINRVGQIEGRVRMEFDQIGGAFEGGWKESNDELSGEWTQLGKPLPLTLKRQPKSP
jgi:outer membrane protein assembly factor BamB